MVGSVPFWASMGMAGGGDLAPGAPAGYDIFVATGDSNKISGQTLDPVLDQGDPRIFQYGITAPNANTIIPANDPLDSISGGTGIGHDVHFIKDYYMPNGFLAAGRNALIVGYPVSGSSVVTTWRAAGGTAGNPSIAAGDVGNYLDIETGRMTAALALSPSNAIVAVVIMDITNDLSNAHVFRYQIYRFLQYMRNLVGPTVPLLLSRAIKSVIDATHITGFMGAIGDGVLQGIPASVPYTGLADSQSPTELLGQDVLHFSAADQRVLAGRYFQAFLDAQANTNGNVTWNSADYNRADWGAASGFTITNNDLDLSGDALTGFKTCRATTPLRTGKAYAEVKVQAVASTTDLGYIGLCNADKSPNSALGVVEATADGPAKMSIGVTAATGASITVGYVKNGSFSVSAAALNDIYMFAVDMATGKAWLGKNGTWANSGDPAAGTGHWISGIVDPIFLAGTVSTGTTNTWRLQPTLASFTYTPPAAFLPWSGGASPSILSFSPATGTLTAAVNATLTVTFAETVTLGASGTIYLRAYGDSAVLGSWNVATQAGSGAGQVEVVGGTVLTLHPSATLTNNVHFYVTWTAGVVRGLASNPVAPLTAKTVWNFWTVLATVTPTAGPQQFMLPSMSQITASGTRQYVTGANVFVEP